MSQIPSFGIITPVFTFASAPEFPAYCTRIAELLLMQPLFKGSGHLTENLPPTLHLKVIAMPTWVDAQMCSLFNRNAGIILEGASPSSIRSFRSGLYDENNHSVTHGLILYDDDDITCPLETMRETYDQVLTRMTTGWVEVDSKDHRYPGKEIDPAEFACFRKDTTPLWGEDTLIRGFASKFSMKDDVLSGTASKRDSYEVLLWIRRSALENVVTTFGFELDGLTRARSPE